MHDLNTVLSVILHIHSTIVSYFQTHRIALNWTGRCSYS